MPINPKHISAMMEAMDYGEGTRCFSKLKEWLKHITLGNNLSSKESAFCLIDDTKYDMYFTPCMNQDFLDNESLKAYSNWHAVDHEVKFFALHKLAGLLKEKEEILVEAEVAINNRLEYDVAKNDIPAISSLVRYYAGLPLTSEELISRSNLFPGICLLIYPSNVTLLDVVYKLIPAIMAGNSVIVAAPSHCCVILFILKDLMERSGLPPNLLLVFPYSSVTVQFLLALPSRSTMYISGKYQEVESLQKLASGRIHHIIADIMSSPFVFVTETADIDSAVEHTAQCLGVWTGQLDVCSTRLFVQSSISEVFEERLRRKLGKLVIGESHCKNCDVVTYPMSAMSSDLEEAKSEGATVESFGCSKSNDKVYLVTNGGTVSKYYRECLPGPVLYLLPFRTILDGLKLVNNSVYGSCGSVWTRDVACAVELAKEMNYANIWVNTHHKYGCSTGPGGFGLSSSSCGTGSRSILNFYRSSRPESYSFVSKYIEFGEDITPDDRANISAPKESVLVNNSLTEPASGMYFCGEVGDRVIPNVPNCGAKDLEHAVNAATTALSSWKRRSGCSRTETLLKVAKKFTSMKSEFVKEFPMLKDAGGYFDEAVKAMLYWFARANESSGSLPDNELKKGFVLNFREPVGVVGIICGISFRDTVESFSCAIALGNTVVMVNCNGPGYSLFLVKALHNCGLPGGVVNIITGYSKYHLPRVLCSHNGVQAVWNLHGAASVGLVQYFSSGNNKRTWTLSNESNTKQRFEAEATRSKCIWLPGGTIFAN